MMTTTQYDIVNLQEVSTEDFFALIDKNRSFISEGFPTTVADCPSLEGAQKVRTHRLQMQQENKGRYFLLRNPSEENYIGYFSIKNLDTKLGKGEFAYFIDEDFQGQGIVSDVVGKMISYAFDNLHLNKIIICTSEDNIPSQQVALKNGFIKEGVLRNEFINHQGELEDVHYFGLIKPKDN